MGGIWGKGRNKGKVHSKQWCESKSVEEDMQGEERELCQWLGMEGRDGK